MRFLAFILILFFNYIVSIASNEPADKKNPTCLECMCKPHKYPVQKCSPSGNGSDVSCVDFPLFNDFNLGNVIFPKFNKNLCFDYVVGSFPFSEGIHNNNGYFDTKPFQSIFATKDTIINGIATEHPYPIFRTFSIVNSSNGAQPSILDSVFKRWKENCPETSSQPSKGFGTTCCIKIRWTTFISDFDDEEEAKIAPARVNKVDHFDKSKKSGNGCNNLDVGCDLEIILNATRVFTRPEHPTMAGQMSNRQPTFFFFTDSIPAPIDKDSKADYRNKYHYVSLEDVLLHEVGHLLGFGHYDSKDGCNDKTVPISESIMAGFVKPNEKHGLSWKDRCAYKRANCCGGSPYSTAEDCPAETTSVVQTNKIQALSYPNPADQWVFVPTTIEGNYSVEIYDYVGRQYFNGSLESFDSKIGIPVGHLANGNYVIRVTMSKNIQDFSIVISR